MEELWVKYKVDGKKDYWVGHTGEIRSVSTIAKTDGHLILGKAIGQYVDKNGYLQVSLLSKTRKAHRLIAMAFLDNPEGKKTVNHKNGIKTDNRVENLEWATCSENVLHSVKTGLTKVKISEEDVFFIRKNYKGMGKKKLSIKYNVCEAYIYSIAIHKDKGYVETEIFQTNSPMPCKAVDQYDIAGNLIAKHSSTKAAARALGVRIGAIQRVVKGERKVLHGFLLKYALE